MAYIKGTILLFSLLTLPTAGAAATFVYDFTAKLRAETVDRVYSSLDDINLGEVALEDLGTVGRFGPVGTKYRGRLEFEATGGEVIALRTCLLGIFECVDRFLGDPSADYFNGTPEAPRDVKARFGDGIASEVMEFDFGIKTINYATDNFLPNIEPEYSYNGNAWYYATFKMSRVKVIEPNIAPVPVPAALPMMGVVTALVLLGSMQRNRWRPRAR